MPTNKTHPELISPISFEQKFKNALRDYYNYGFKSRADYTKSQGSPNTVGDIWERLNRILRHDFKWSESANGKPVRFISTDSQTNTFNPFQKVYRFCLYNDTNMLCLFHMVFALSKEVSLTGGIDSLQIESYYPEGELNSETIEARYKLQLHLEQNPPVLTDSDHTNSKDKPFDGIPHLTTRELFYFFPDGTLESPRNLNNRLNQFQNLGILRRSGPRSPWFLSSRTLSSVLAAGDGIDSKSDFCERFEATLDFYSKYFILGETGIYIRDRMGAGQDSPFRMKHEYYMQALNDYILIDLIHAIENGYWCLIDYSNGMRASKRAATTRLLCFPLEVRISTAQGREYLAFYEPFHHSYSFLRLEFIDSILYYEEKTLKKTFASDIFDMNQIESEIDHARASLKYCWGTSTTAVQEGNALNKVVPTKVTMRISYSPEHEKFIAERAARESRIGTVEENPDGGYIQFQTDVSDPHEMVPWIRSFYSRISEVTGVESDTFKLQDDVRICYQALTNTDDPEKESSQTFPSRIRPGRTDLLSWNMDDKLLMQLPQSDKKINDTAPHKLLFHELFSSYYHIMADTLMQICRIGAKGNALVGTRYSEGKKAGTTYKDIDDCLQNAIEKYSYISGDKTAALIENELKPLLTKSSGLGRLQRACRVPKNLLGEYNVNHPEFSNNSTDENNSQQQKGFHDLMPFYAVKKKGLTFYRDLLPLTDLECRWLLTILDDDKIHYFLTDKEIEGLRSVLNPNSVGYEDLKPFPMEVIHYYDRFIQPKMSGDSSRQHEDSRDCVSKATQAAVQCIADKQTIMNRVLSAIRGRRVVYVDYKTNIRTIHGRFIPIQLEYSKRDDCFRGYFQSCEDKRIYIFKLSSIFSLTISDEEQFDRAQAQQALTNYLENKRRSVTVQFTDSRNVPDRILTEFSPWEKECVYDREKNLYTLIIHYQENDWKELTVRLMNYGAGIHFTDRQDPIYIEIKKRLEKQMDLFDM